MEVWLWIPVDDKRHNGRNPQTSLCFPALPGFSTNIPKLPGIHRDGVPSRLQTLMQALLFSSLSPKHGHESPKTSHPQPSVQIYMCAHRHIES